MRRDASAGSGRPHWGEQGFTLLEIIAALAIIGLLLMVAWVRATNTGAAVASDAAILRSHLRFLQAMAMGNNTVVWSMSLGNGSYLMQRDGAPSTMNLPDENGPSRTLSHGVVLSGGTGVITFDEWGVPDAPRVIVLSDGTTQHSISILGGTGLIP